MDKKQRIQELLEICKNNQGEYIPSHHGSGSWATTYSNKFINAAAEIFQLLDGFQAYKEFQLSQLFIENNIYSCRGGKMTISKVEYLYKTHLESILDEQKPLQSQ